MFDWLWRVVAGAAGLVALWLGFNTARMRRRMEWEKQERDEATQRMTEKAYRDLTETRKRYAAQAPINPEKRTDFE